MKRLLRHMTALCAAFALPGGNVAAQADDPRCVEARTVAIPAADRPSARDAAALASCDSATLYYGIGIPADAVDARHCAYLEHDAGSDGLFSGAGILFLVYANAQGVARDVALARRFACAIEGAPAELSARLGHLDALAEDPDGAGPVDACDFATSGYAMGFCAEHAASIARVERAKRLARVRTGWDDETDAAYTRLRAAADRFIDARVEGEVDLSGSARGCRTAMRGSPSARRAHPKCPLRPGSHKSRAHASSRCASSSTRAASSSARSRIRSVRDDVGERDHFWADQAAEDPATHAGPIAVWSSLRNTGTSRAARASSYAKVASSM